MCKVYSYFLSQSAPMVTVNPEIVSCFGILLTKEAIFNLTFEMMIFFPKMFSAHFTCGVCVNSSTLLHSKWK